MTHWSTLGFTLACDLLGILLVLVLASAAALGEGARRAKAAEMSGATVVANPLAGVIDPADAILEQPVFRRRQRRRTIAPEVGYSNFSSGIRAGWEVEYASIKFRQVRAF